MSDLTEPTQKKDEFPLDLERLPVTSDHSIEVDGQLLSYTATAGYLPLNDENGKPKARIFYIAYTVKSDQPRPLMFSFNGGPGSSSVWLHLGAVGPKRVKLLDDGGLPPAPYQLLDNEESWLAETDLVFIDPVGTGYSRAKDKETAKEFFGLEGDVESIGEFIRLYLTRSDRWASPLYLVGESYGTTRAAGLASHLIDLGVAFNGIVLVSSILNFLTARWFKGNDLPNVLFLPTYAATAHFHGKAGAGTKLEDFLPEVERFATGEYSAALAQGDLLDEETRASVVSKLAQYTGLSERFIELTNLRINIHQFCKELLREQGRTVGRLDSRFKGIDPHTVLATPEFDPSMSAIMPPYTAMLNDYIGRVLGWKIDNPYFIFGRGINENWDWGKAQEGTPDVSEQLRKAFAKNPHMKLFIASGYYDLATPYFATKHTLAHMGLDRELRGNVSTAEYPAGHMMYVHVESLRKLHRDIREFIQSSL